MGVSPWRPDVLGPAYEQRDLPLPGGALATLVRRVEAGGIGGQVAVAGGSQGKPAVLYLHGFVDYFFHPHVADAYESRGYRFYAIDLRSHGRSLGRGAEEGQPNYVRQIAVYAADLDAAATAIRQEGHDRLVLLGHSTGGLIGPLWAAARPGALTALVLNSPWLDFNSNWLMRGPVTGLMHGLAKVAPKLKVSGLTCHYGQALHQGTGGEWDYDLAWKPHQGFPVGAAWFSSVRRAQARVKRGLAIDCPVLMMTSLRRGDNLHYHDELLTTDSVLDPRQMWRLASRLGPDVEVRALAGGAHDLALSPEPVRSRYLTETLDWLDAVT
ncbi:MAG: alpha/beta hydrolase [Bifidobacteriaceae bacterium]|jgi:alpha-beta hydrolase superfamily lysophospholipase|nr:alpha/beta hydrolase [Bifidobacteriaceae bacterium]